MQKISNVIGVVILGGLLLLLSGAAAEPFAGQTRTLISLCNLAR